MTDIIIITLLALIWFQGTRWSSEFSKWYDAKSRQFTVWRNKGK